MENDNLKNFENATVKKPESAISVYIFSVNFASFLGENEREL